MNGLYRDHSEAGVPIVSFETPATNRSWDAASVASLPSGPRRSWVKLCKTDTRLCKDGRHPHKTAARSMNGLYRDHSGAGLPIVSFEITYHRTYHTVEKLRWSPSVGFRGFGRSGPQNP